MSALGSFWRGERPLGQTFWLFFIVPSIIVYAVLTALMMLDNLPFVLFIIMLCADIALFGWLATGLIRSGESHVAGRGSLTPVWGSYLAIVIAIFVFGTMWLGLFQQTIEKPEEELFTTKMDRLHASTYNLSLSDDDRILTLDGDIALGSTKIIGKMLSDKPAIASLVLNSTGGNIYEARGIARLVVTRDLDTRIDDECSSACTIIFISGKERSMDPNARLGFHQYRMDSTASIPNVDIVEEQGRDRTFFEMQSISPEFLEKIFESPHNAIWYPERTELVAAGVITLQ